MYESEVYEVEPAEGDT